MASKANLLFKALLVFVLAQHIDAEAHQSISAATCGLEELDPNSSPTNPITLEPFPDNLQSGTRAWTTPIFGQVVAIAVDPSTGHNAYLTASFSVNSKTYWMNANAKTKDFVKEQKTRLMKRYVTIRCQDGTSTKYHLEIPIQDVVPPAFAQSEYTFNITPDWSPNRPISEGQFVVVSDHAIELEDLKWSLSFVASPRDIIRVVAHPLWVLPYPASYYFRLDLFLKEDVKLETGENIQINLSALDLYNVGTTKININVAE